MTERNTHSPESAADETVMRDTLAVVLAAGAGTRWEGPTPKALAPLPDGSTMLDHACEQAISAGIGPTVLVVVAGPTAAHPLVAGATAVVNPQPGRGLASSLQVALAEARRRGAGAVVIGLADQPGLAVAAWRAVAKAAATPLAVATYDGHRGHPVRIAAAAWPLLPVEGDRGARDLLDRDEIAVTEVPVDGDPTDIDRQRDMAAWHAQTAHRRSDTERSDP